MQTTKTRWTAFAGMVLGAALAAGCGGSDEPGPTWKPGDPVTLDVSAAFPAGSTLRDAYSGALVTVGTDGKVTVAPGAEGVVLLEKHAAVPPSAPPAFRWDAATVYFAITDRFENGDPNNDHSYGREDDGAQETGTWHGGDLAGLTAKLDYLVDLGVSAIWISPPVEQVHGWVAGGSIGAFKAYGYAGYWALDFTRLDANLGTEDDLRTFVDTAHAKGIRVVLDVVMNHPGYATGQDMYDYFPEVFKDGTGDAFLAYDAVPHTDYRTFYDLVTFVGGDWSHWWGKDWVRAGLGDYTFADSPLDDHPLTGSVGSLPDFFTEATAFVPRPALFDRKTDTNVVTLPDATVREYLIDWHTRWVRDFGIDGFRCDTAKHVELEAWAELEAAATAALSDWKAANPTKRLDDLPFWSVAEVWDHGVVKDDYFLTARFDSVINFDFWETVRPMLDKPSLVDSATTLEQLYSFHASALQDPEFDALSYLSSHDTRLTFGEVGEDVEKQKMAGTALLLVPGSAQIFYGDESGRRYGPFQGDSTAGTRSDMNWTSLDTAILDHWKKLGVFRRWHPAVGAGTHQRLASPEGTYAFARKLGADDAVVVVLARKG